jgi:hypothetical protein
MYFPTLLRLQEINNIYQVHFEIFLIGYKSFSFEIRPNSFIFIAYKFVLGPVWTLTFLAAIEDWIAAGATLQIFISFLATGTAFFSHEILNHIELFESQSWKKTLCVKLVGCDLNEWMNSFLIPAQGLFALKLPTCNWPRPMSSRMET